MCRNRRYDLLVRLAFIPLLWAGPLSAQYLAACAHWKNTSADSLCRYARLARQQASAGGSEGDRALADCYCAQCLLMQAKTDSARQVLGQAFAALKDSTRWP